MASSFEVENKEVEAMLKDIGKTLHGIMPEGFGFTLLMFSFGENGSTFYISDAQRDDMLKAMQEFIDKQKAAK